MKATTRIKFMGSMMLGLPILATSVTTPSGSLLDFRLAQPFSG